VRIALLCVERVGQFVEPRPQTFVFALAAFIFAPFVLLSLIFVLLLAALRLYTSALIGAALLLPILYLVYLYEVDVYETEPVLVVGATFVTGAVLGMGYALVTGHFISGTIGGTQQGPFVSGVVLPLIAQLLMVVGPLLLLSHSQFDESLDGLTFGVTAALGFTGASALCATATSLGQMIVYRAMQGFSGGAMMPLVFPVVYTKFRMPQLATIMVLIGLILNLSSTLGPTIGGYLTDTFSWHWLFLVNIVPGIAVAGAVWLLIDIDKPEVSLLRHFDFCGLVLMALFLGCLQYALQEGPRWDWLSDGTILTAVIVSSIASVLFFWRVLTYHQPIVDLRAFLNRNFALGSFYTFVVGTGLYGATYVIPLFLAQVRGYSAFQIGMVVVVTGLAQMAMSPFTAYIARKLDLRIMLAIGMGLFAVAMYLTAGLTNQASFWELFVPQALRGCALMFCYLPANLIALGTVPRDKLKNAAGHHATVIVTR